MADLTQKEWTSQINSSEHPVVLDVRTQEEVLEGYIPNAIHIDISWVKGLLMKLKNSTSQNIIMCIADQVAEAHKPVLL